MSEQTIEQNTAEASAEAKFTIREVSDEALEAAAFGQNSMMGPTRPPDSGCGHTFMMCP